jgi:hypothetical protein
LACISWACFIKLPNPPFMLPLLDFSELYELVHAKHRIHSRG